MDAVIGVLSVIGFIVSLVLIVVLAKQSDYHIKFSMQF